LKQYDFLFITDDVKAGAAIELRWSIILIFLRPFNLHCILLLFTSICLVLIVCVWLWSVTSCWTFLPVFLIDFLTSISCFFVLQKYRSSSVVCFQRRRQDLMRGGHKNIHENYLSHTKRHRIIQRTRFICSRDWTTAHAVAECKYVWRGNRTKSLSDFVQL